MKFFKSTVLYHIYAGTWTFPVSHTHLMIWYLLLIPHGVFTSMFSYMYTEITFRLAICGILSLVNLMSCHFLQYKLSKIQVFSIYDLSVQYVRSVSSVCTNYHFIKYDLSAQYVWSVISICMICRLSMYDWSASSVFRSVISVCTICQFCMYNLSLLTALSVISVYTIRQWRLCDLYAILVCVHDPSVQLLQIAN